MQPPLIGPFRLWLSAVLIGPKEAFLAGEEAQREQIIAMLREIEKLTAQGMSIPMAAHKM